MPTVNNFATNAPGGPGGPPYDSGGGDAFHFMQYKQEVDADDDYYPPPDDWQTVDHSGGWNGNVFPPWYKWGGRVAEAMLGRKGLYWGDRRRSRAFLP